MAAVSSAASPAAAPPRLHVRFRHGPLEPDATRALVADPAAGATVVMVGTTRATTDGVETASLWYEAHEALAGRLLHELLAAVAADLGLVAAAVEHRLGRVAVGEASIVVAVSSPHRRGAFAAAERIVAEVKRTVPIWKCDERPDGSRSWVHPGDLRAATAPGGAS